MSEVECVRVRGEMMNEDVDQHTDETGYIIFS